MHLDRTQAPTFQAIREVRLPLVDTHTLDNGQPFYVVAVQQQPVLRLEVILDAGAWHETTPATAFFALKMLAEGTSARTSAQISEAFDRYGAFLELNSGPDRASVVVYCLTRHLATVLPLVRELLTDPIFPEKELEDLRNITLQSLRVNYEKNNYVAGVRFREQIFGAAHPYGRGQRPDAVEQVTRPAIVDFYERVMRNRPFRVLLAGQVTVQEMALVNNVLGQLPVGNVVDGAAADARNGHVTQPPNNVVTNAPVVIEKPDSMQSSVRVGRRLFTRQHPDFFRMLVTNEVLGGYFGSRLMKNIREDKGFTYGVSSSVVSFRRDGYFLIGTDVKREFTQQTLDEIRKEIRRLQTEPVPADELETVKNFMAGEFVGSLNTPFEIADRYKVILLDGLPDDFLSQYVPRLRAVSPDDILAMTNQYLTDDALTNVVVGGLV